MILISPKNEYPRYIGDLQIEHPEWKEGDALPEGWVEVAMTPSPTISKYETFYEGEPTEIDGVLSQNWVVRDMTEDEKARIDAPATARQKFIDLGLTEIEIDTLLKGLR